MYQIVVVLLEYEFNIYFFHFSLYSVVYLCDKVVPGNRVTILGIYSIKKNGKTTTKKSSKEKVSVGVRAPYLRVLGIQIETTGSGRSAVSPFTPAEEEQMRRLAALPNIYEKISKSVAPSIYGSDDVKKAIACLLFGGSRKRLPDGLTRRGDINVLLLGDPGTAKSQLLKFVEKVSPIGVYTSGKGSSAAGLTASVNRDPTTRNFVMEGGAMVLADGGVVCIDEFDKMREDDRVAIHEAMEQQTISIAKAGITTTLNSRCSVLAAANSVFGRWDDMKGEENIDFMPTILSRFDMIFIVKDEHDEKRDTRDWISVSHDLISTVAFLELILLWRILRSENHKYEESSCEGVERRLFARSGGLSELAGPLDITRWHAWNNFGACKNLKFFGGRLWRKADKHQDYMDGHKAVCLDEQIRPVPGNCLVYSFGVNDNWSFEDAMLKYGCEVHGFDPTIGEPKQTGERQFIFHKI
ncbi:hypothetical protein QYM36_014872, partial [Artemia franciscana]